MAESVASTAISRLHEQRVKVAVRCRPFLGSESESEAVKCGIHGSEGHVVLQGYGRVCDCIVYQMI